MTTVPPPPRAAPSSAARRDALTTALFTGPLLLFIVAFLLLPAAAVLLGALRADPVNGAGGGFTLKYVLALGEPQYLSALKNSVLLSSTSAVLGALLGGLLAYAVIGEGGPAWLRGPLVSFSGVAANFAGIPLALAFVATLGTTGIVTRWLSALGLNLYGSGFSLFSFSGLVLVYLYFQIPLMVILIAPALDGLRREWREAAENLGASGAQFWRWVALPVLTPALLASAVLLFGNAFAAYATPYALTSGVLPLLPLQIGAALSGNVLTEPQQGRALALLVIAVMTVTMVLYTVLERRSSRWRQ